MKAVLHSGITAPVLDHSVYLQEKAWLAQQAKNTQVLQPMIMAHRQRRLNGEKHPIVDFLFDYYHFKPSKLLQWSPGIGLYLTGSQTDKFLTQKGFNRSNHGVFVDPLSFPCDRIAGLEWTINLLDKTLKNKPQINCFGLHEWCMVYEKSDIRHPQLPLRLSHQQTRAVVERHNIQCTHYDAYRFYSASAVNFNKAKLDRDGMSRHEQPGCLHTNMDLYRWAYKFHPWVSSELVAATFLLALEIREIDMRASPYDVSDYTNKPAIAIETTQGKSEYVELQKDFTERAQPIRKQLLCKLRKLREKQFELNQTDLLF